MTPGLTLTNPQVLARGERPVLLSGLSQSVQGFTALPYVGQKIGAIAPLYPSVQLLNTRFRCASVRTELARAPYAFVLFSTHSRVLGDPWQSFLLA